MTFIPYIYTIFLRELQYENKYKTKRKIRGERIMTRQNIKVHVQPEFSGYKEVESTTK